MMKPVVQATEMNAGHDDEMLRNALVQGVAMGIPGFSVGIGSGDDLVWKGCAGYSDLLRKTPVRPDDRFGIGSITKTFVARVILQLVQEDRLDLNRTAADYLDPEILQGISNADRATLRQLLNHQSGVPDWEFLETWIRKGRGGQMVPGKIWNKTETLETIRNAQLPAVHPPGQRYAYTNTNYTLLGLIIEAVTSNNAAVEIRRRIIQPLGLENTFFESFEAIPGGYVHHYHYATPQFTKVAGIHPKFTEIRPYLIETTAANLSAEWTAGGMVSSASDLVRWARAIRRGELLGPVMQKEVFTYYPPEDPQDSQEEYMQGVWTESRTFTTIAQVWGMARYAGLHGCDVLAGKYRCDRRYADQRRRHAQRPEPLPGRGCSTGKCCCPQP